MTELFKLLGTIAIDNSDANKALDDTSSKGEKTQSKLSKAFGAVGKGAVAVGKTVATGLAVGATAFAGLAAKALSAGGELEQNMGGSEAVFKDYAGKMQETAKTAFSQMGLSTSDYLATANKMGALFQGAGFSIEESMNLSSDAMQRAADVASIMGIDTGAAMEAIAGAAKGNFTMMDNLGVAMNDTTIQAYALSKGIDKSTSEMTNQEKIGLAMEMFMDKTAYAAGNYAKENETLAGSLGTAKAALTNFLDGSGSVEDLVASFGNLANVAVTSLQEILPRLTTGLTGIVNQVMPMLPPLLQKCLPPIIDGATSLISGLVSVLPGLLDMVTTDLLPSAISAIEQIFNSLVTALPGLMESICSALPTLLPLLISALVSMIVTLCTNFSQIIQPILDNLPTIIMSIVSALVSNLPILLSGIISLVLGICSALPQIIEQLTAMTPMIIEMVVSGLISCLPQLLAGLLQLIVAVCRALPSLLSSTINGAIGIIIGLFSGLWTGISNIFAPIAEWLNSNVVQPVIGFFQELWQGVKNAWDWICNAIDIAIQFIGSIIDAAVQIITIPFRFIWENCKEYVFAAWNWIKEKVSTAINAVKNVINNVMTAIKNFLSPILNAIKNTFSTVWTAIKNAVTTAVNAVKSVVTNIWNSIKTATTTAWNAVKNAISVPINAAKNAISNVVNSIKNTISNVFNSVKNTVGNIFNSIKEKMSAPIEKARDTIKGIIDKIKGFFSGMKLSFPNIKLPHFGISPSGWKIGDLLQGSIPKLSIQWYAEAMKNPMIMTRPTIFGYDASTGKLMGGGEAGSEVVSGTGTLMNMIQTAVSAQNEAVVKVLTAILNAIVGGNQEMLRALLADKTFKVGEREFARLVREYA